MSALCPRAWWGALYATSTQEKLAKYCKKDGNFVEKGAYSTKQQQGKSEKDRYEKAWAMAKSGDLEAIDADIRVRCYGTLKRIYNDERLDSKNLKDLEGPMEHEWYFGEGGTGKTMVARKENPGAFIKSCNKWWDGYKGEEVVIVEDFDIRHECLTHHMKIWCDRWIFPAEVKGASFKIRPRKIIVTSNYKMEDIWKNDAQALQALTRRYKVREFTEKWDESKSDEENYVRLSAIKPISDFPIFNYN